MAALSINLEKIARGTSLALPAAGIVAGAAGYYLSFYFHFATVTLLLLWALDLYYRFGQSKHALLANFGVLAQARYLTESIGPELRQYLFSGDLIERPFNRLERAEVYRKAKAEESTAAFGSRLAFDASEIKLRHSMYPTQKDAIAPYRLTFGDERGVPSAFTIEKPVLISAMSFGSLSARAVRALARGAARAGIAMNTGEGGWPKHHLAEGCDLVFQMGTAKFGVRHEDGSLDDGRLAELSALAPVKMIEIKFSQGAKPGKGGILPKEKITDEIAELRGVRKGADVISPAYHLECTDPAATVRFVRRVQEVSGLPTGIKLCLGRPAELAELVGEMKAQDVFPDYIAIDGGEGGTGAAPRGFMDELGLPLLSALPTVRRLLEEFGVRDRTKLLAAGKLIHPARQLVAMSLGADAVYTARGFMLAMGCIQALQCNVNTCPVGITTHEPKLVHGLDVERKATRVANYVAGLMHDHAELLASLGCRSYSELSEAHLYAPELSDLASPEVHRPVPSLEAHSGARTP